MTTRRRSRDSRVCVIVVGEPIVPETRTGGVVAREKVDALTATLADSLQSLYDQAYEVRATL